jgi:MFS family permease
MSRLLANANARLYLAGQGLSVLGDTSMWLAAAIWAKSLTGSSSAAGLVFFAFTLPQLAAPLAGLLVDRVRRRPLLIAVNVGMAAGLLPLVLVRTSSDVWLLYAVMVLYGTVNGVLGAGQNALLPAMLPVDVLADANGALQAIGQGLRIVSPLLGAGLFAWRGGATVAVLDALTFLAAAGALLAVRMEEPAPAPGEGRWIAEVTAGVDHVRRTPILLHMAVAGGMAMLLFGFMETLVFATVDAGLHRPPTFVGVLLTVQGVGAIGGGVLSGPLVRRLGGRLVFGAGLAAASAAGLLLAAPALPVVVPAMVLFGLSFPWLLVSLATVVQLMTPSRLRGRVSSAFNLLVGVPQTLAIALGAALVTVLDYRALLVAAALLTIVSAVYVLTRPERGAETLTAITPLGGP